MKDLKIKKLEFLLIELNESAKELMNYGNSKEKRQGYGMKEVINAVRNLYKNEYLKELKLEVEHLLLSYLEGTDYRGILEGLTNDENKINSVMLEVKEHYNKFVNPNVFYSQLDELQEIYTNNIIEILNN